MLRKQSWRPTTLLAMSSSGSLSGSDAEDAVYCTCCGEQQHPDWTNEVCDNCVCVAVDVMERTPEGKEMIDAMSADGTLDEHILQFCVLNADNYDWIQEFRDMRAK
jgi:hypothetical protein